MEGILYVTLVICILFIIILIYLYGNQVENVRKIKEEYYNRDRKELDSIFEKEYKEKSFQIEQLDKILHNLQSNIERTKKVNEEELERLFEEKRKNKKKELELEISEWLESAQEAAEFRAEIERKPLEDEAAAMKKSLEELKGEVEDYKARRNVINEEILRARAIEEQQDFYRIQIPEAHVRDIELLNSVRPQIQKVDILDKLIYDNYVKKPVEEMEKRVLNGRAPCGIYKITRLKTGEIYIGQSTDIKARWSQHAKSAYHCGTISHSTLHTTMEKDGIWNFTFELLEEVEKADLRKRETYWIQFYDSKKYGMNEKE